MRPSHTYFNLLGLPNELLLRIIEREVHHEDLDNLTLCSKTIFNLADKAHAKHLECKQKFTTLSVGLPPLSVQPAFALKLLVDNDAVFDYCKILRLGHYSNTILLPTAAAKDLKRDVDHQLAALKAVRPAVTISVPNIEYYELHDVVYSVLLDALPNIEILELPHCMPGNLYQRVEAESRPLTHRPLKEVRLIGDGGDRTDACDIWFPAPSISMRKLYGLHITGDDFSPYRAFNLTRLEGFCFKYSAIDRWVLETLVMETRVLKSFYYEHTDDFTHHYAYEPRGLIKKLHDHASGSLQSLTLIDPSRDASEEDMTVPGSYLQKFKVLIHVGIECSLFIEEPLLWADQDTALEDGFFSDKDLESEVSRLVDMLPRTLETLVLYHPRDHDDVKGIFSGLVELKEE
ncbi:MAG: hypothetical protein L6R40_008620 [Gallowayella cf. fulva]|nr:MAG: hypothetical protein L6R40_008620 [Xanthomendoza cf. fulva]